MASRLLTLLEEARRDLPVDPAYFFFPGYLTPNGELHLGHLSGPYLRADAAARHLRLHGADVTVATASDAFESGVSFEAAQQGRPDVASELAARFTDRARAALAGMSMPVEAFLDPSEDANRGEVERWCSELVDALDRQERIRVVEESLLVGNEPGPRIATGGFVSGRCEPCGSDQSGNVCEGCGRWLSPAAMERAWEPDGPGTAERTTVRTAVLVEHEDIGRAVDDGVLAPAWGYLATERGTPDATSIRLSYPSWWGVPWSGTTTPLDDDAVFSSYVLGKYASTRVLGRHVRASQGVDPFVTGSTVTTVATGGLDSAFGWLALTALVGAVDFRSFDHVLVNRFLTLDGDKFSTSRKHVIRVNDALDAGLDPDVVRLALAAVAPRHAETDFAPAEVARRSAQEVALLTAAAQGAQDGSSPADGSGEGSGAAGGEGDLDDAARVALRAQRQAFALPDIDLAAAHDVLLDWAGRRSHLVRDGDDPRPFVQVLAVLAAPLLPRWAAEVWQRAGGEGLAALEGPATPSRALVPLEEDVLVELVERGRQA